MPFSVSLTYTWRLTNSIFIILFLTWGKIAMCTTKGRQLFSAKFHYLIIEQTLMRDMDQHNKRYYLVPYKYTNNIGAFLMWLILLLYLNYGQIRMSNETERRVESLLAKAKSNSNDSASTSTLTTRQSRPSTSSSVTESTKDIDKERLSSELRDIQNSRKVMPTILQLCKHIIFNCCAIHTSTPKEKGWRYTFFLGCAVVLEILSCMFLLQMMPSARSMQSFRDKLPAFKMREEFLKAVAANQVRNIRSIIWSI